MAAGRLASEDLPEIAVEALVRGLDSPALRILAGQARSDVRDSADLFRVALDELGIELPDADRARWRLARCTAGDIVTGRIGAVCGANELWLAYRPSSARRPDPDTCARCSGSNRRQGNTGMSGPISSGHRPVCAWIARSRADQSTASCPTAVKARIGRPSGASTSCRRSGDNLPPWLSPS